MIFGSVVTIRIGAVADAKNEAVVGAEVEGELSGSLHIKLTGEHGAKNPRIDTSIIREVGDNIARVFALDIKGDIGDGLGPVTDPWENIILTWVAIIEVAVGEILFENC